MHIGRVVIEHNASCKHVRWYDQGLISQSYMASERIGINLIRPTRAYPLVCTLIMHMHIAYYNNNIISKYAIEEDGG